MPYVKIGTAGSLDVLESLKKGPQKVKNIEGEEVYPTLDLRKSQKEEEQKDIRVLDDYDAKVKKWNDWFSGFLSDIKTRANKILKDDFKYDFTINLNLEEAAPKTLTEHDFTFKHPVISITIPEYAKKKNVVKTPHTFLNEAKWSAIGLSIRFAIIDKRLSYSASNPIDLQVLVIDDMLISLDMSNRDTVLDILLEKYAKDFQIILMTHDRFLFELAQRKINQLNQDNWQYLEMFEDDSVMAKPKPLILETTSKIEKCWALFYRKELALAANTLRRAVEKMCKNYLTPHELLNRDYSKKQLHEKIEAFKSKATANGIDGGKLSNLIEYKDRILNPNSHYDIETPIFKNELKKAIETVEKIADEINTNV